MKRLSKIFFPFLEISNAVSVKKTLILCGCILLCALSWQTKAQSFFEGFENWTDTLNTHIPNGWSANSIVTNLGDSTYLNVSRVPALTENEYALQITNNQIPSLEGYGNNAISIPFETPDVLVDISFTAKCEGEGYCEFRLGPAYWQVEAGSNETYTVLLEDIFISDVFSSLKIILFVLPNDTGNSTPGIAFFTIDDLEVAPSVEPNSCNTTDPLSMPWLIDLTENTSEDCIIKEVVQFEAEGVTLFKVDVQSCNYVYDKYYDCLGNIFCTDKQYPDESQCSADIEAAGSNGIQIWERICTDTIEYEITTPPFCVSDELFTVGITLNTTKSYLLGKNHLGKSVYNSRDNESFIGYRKGEGPYIINPKNRYTGCTTQDIIFEEPDCENQGSSCEIEDPLNELPWLQVLIDKRYDFDCDSIGGAKKKYDGYTLFYRCEDGIGIFEFRAPECCDFWTVIYDATGCLVSQFEGRTDPNGALIWSCYENCGCPETLVKPVCGQDGNNYINECFAQCAETEVEKKGACDESLCNDFTFTNSTILCDTECNDYFEFELTGGDGNYTINNGGKFVISGDPVVYVWPGDYTATLTAIDGNGCLTEVAIPAAPCSVQPSLFAPGSATCIGDDLFIVQVKILGNTGNYLVGVDENGADVIGSPGDLVNITFSSSDFKSRIDVTNLDLGCTTNVFLSLRNPNCFCSTSNPIDLEVVQNAINNGCTKTIYAFEYEGQLNVYMENDTMCEGKNIYNQLYNCKTGDINYLIDDFESVIDEIGTFLIEENKIWTKENNCADPFQIEIVQNAMQDDCVASIYSFEYDNETYVYIDIKVSCETIDKYDQAYNCNTDETCPFGFSCFSSPLALEAMVNEENLLWANYDCADPFEFEFVQEAINYDCTDAIYAFIYQNQSYIYVDQLCEQYDGGDYLYNCNTTEMCIIGGLIDSGEDCRALFYEIQYLLTEENTIWRQPCNYEQSGIVQFNGCGFSILLESGQNVQQYYSEFPFYEGQQVELSFVELHNTFQCLIDEFSAIEVRIICIREVETNTAIFETYSWLNNIVNTETCTGGATVTAYDYSGGNYTFLHIANPNGEGDLYFQDGTFYCSDALGYSCIEAYSLTQTLESWTCNNPIMPADKNELFEQYSWLNNYANPTDCNAFNKVTEYNFGSYSFLFIEDSNGGKLYFEDGTFYCATALGYNCLALYGFDTPTANWTCENPTESCIVDDPFSLAWFQELVSVDPELGIPGIFRYENDYYPAAISEIWQIEFEGDAYFKAKFGILGPLIDALGYAIFDCSGAVDCYIGSLVEPNSETVCQYLDNIEANAKLIWTLPNQQDIFNTYPWLAAIANPENCLGTSIKVYTKSPYEFISIENNEGKNLYFQDGTFYCSDGPNYNCAELYSLNELKSEWNCEGIMQKQATTIAQQKVAFDVDFKTYPNPSNGQFVVELSQNNTTGLVSIICTDGRLVKTIHIEPNQKQTAIDLTGAAKGIYILQLQIGNNTKTQRMIIR